MHKCHNYHAIVHKLYTWFGKTNLGILKRSKKFSIGGRPPGPPLNTPMQYTTTTTTKVCV